MSALRKEILALGFAALGLAACATDYGNPGTAPVVMVPPSAAGAAPTAPSVVVPGTGYIAPPVTPVQPPLALNYPHTIQESDAGPAVLSLYRQAQDARAANQPDRAQDYLTRAMHIEPRNAFVWQSLAGVFLDLKQPEQAVHYAERSTSLARGNPYIVAGNWRLVAAARQALGDANGALEAQAQADTIARTLPPDPAVRAP